MRGSFDHAPGCWSCECGGDGEPAVDHEVTPDCYYDARNCVPECPVARGIADNWHPGRSARDGEDA